ncbi:MAG: glycosyltransferase family 4 protein [Thermoplasmata archaeon]|nr:glycosyltransferase family 4 protein [Thermoplasmata archaeon]
MRIVLIGTGVEPIPPTGYGGVERTIAEYATALRAAGQEPVVVQQVRQGRSSDEYRFALQLPRLLEGLDAEVLHASTPVVANRLSWSGRPYVYTSHSRHWFTVAGISQRWGFLLERRAVAWSAATVALTDELSARMSSRLGRQLPARHPVIPIGVDAERFRPEWGARTGRRALGVGIVAPLKRWELAARALRGTGWELRIVGPVTDPAYARQVREAGDRVELMGEVTEEALQRAYAESDLLIHPSAAEILSGTVLQALAAGLPVLGAAPIGSLIAQGATGWTSPAGASEEQTVELLRSRSGELGSDAGLRRRMGEAARAQALDRFAWRSVVERHLALYREVRAAE